MRAVLILVVEFLQLGRLLFPDQVGGLSIGGERGALEALKVEVDGCVQVEVQINVRHRLVRWWHVVGSSAAWWSSLLIMLLVSRHWAGCRPF